MNASDRSVARPPSRQRPLALWVHLLILTLAVLLPALGAGGFTAWQLGGAYRQVVETALQGGARTLTITIDREIEVAITAAASLAGTRAVRSLAEAGPDQPEAAVLAELYERARAVGEAFGGWVVLVRADGRQIFNTQRPLGTALPVAAGLPWVTRAITTSAPVVSDLFVGSVTQRPVLAAVAPVPAAGTAEPLALILAFDTSRLATLLAHVKPGEIAGLIQVTDGITIARSAGHAAATGRVAPAWIAGPLQAQAMGLASGASQEGEPIVAAFQRLDRVPWAVVITASEADYTAAWRGPLNRLAVGAAALLAASLVLAALLTRRLLRPVRALVREAEADTAASTPAPPFPVAEFEALRLALGRAAETARARAISEGRAAAAEEAAQTLRLERDRARLYFDMAQALLVVLEPDGRVRSINRHGLLTLGLAKNTPVAGRDWFDSFLPHRLRSRMREVFGDLVAGRIAAPGSFENPVLREDGAERLVAWRNTLLRDPQGRLIAVIASGEDITERRAAEARQVLLTREVDHRAKNALAVVQSILRLTRADAPQDFAVAVEGRVNALARAHTLLAREHWGGGDLRELVAAELAPYAAAGGLEISGPPVRLVPDAVQPVSLVLHELATNAAKHGAFAAPGGRLEVSWTLLPDGRLRLAWQESRLPMALAGPPTRRGFGSRMIMATVTGQLHGSVHFTWQDRGLRCEVMIAADRLAPVEPESNALAAREHDAPPAGPQAPLMLEQQRVLVVEDEPMVAMDMETMLRSFGCLVVGPAGTLSEALRLADQEAGRLDAAVLDVNLSGQAAFPVADLLVARGVPVVFATGYSELPGGWTPVGGQGRTALLRKPVDAAALGAALSRLLAPQAEPPRAGGRLPPTDLLRRCPDAGPF